MSETAKVAEPGGARFQARGMAPGWWTALSNRHKHFPLAVGLCVFAAAYWVAFKFTVDPTAQEPSPFWLPNSILLCALLRSRPRHWWIFLLITLPIRLTDNIFPPHPVWYRLGATAISALQAMAGALAFRLIAPHPGRFGSWREWLALGATMMIAAAAALLMAGQRHALGQDYWQAFQLGFAGDALALVVVTPAMLTWLFWKGSPVTPLSVASTIEAALLLAALLLTSYLGFISTNPLDDFAESRFFLPIPLLYWAALRFGMAGASIAVLIVTGFAIHSHPLLQTIGLLQQTIDFDAYLGSTPTAILSRFLFFRAVPVYVVAGLVERRQRAELSVRESETRFRNMANTAPVLIWMSGTDKLCDFVNQVWLDFTGHPLEEELGNGWVEAVHPGDLEQCLHTYEAAFDAHKPFRREYRLRNRDGNYRWILDIGVPRFDSSNDFCGYIGSAIDITEQRQAHENNAHIGHLQRLAQMGLLTASIAHELRQPLSVILLHSGTLRTRLRAAGIHGAEIEETLADIDQSCRRASDMLASIRNQVRKREDQFVPVDVNAAVLDCMSLIALEVRRRHTKVVTELASDLPLVNGVPTEILQVFLNLMSNAMDAMTDTPHAGRCITLKTERQGDFVQLSVLDCGHGIKSEDMPALFDSFFTTRAGGMGLGLAIVRSIVQTHRGRVWAENLASGGAAFHFTLPVSRAPLAA
jgi:PAS domain S-box-containing protein